MERGRLEQIGQIEQMRQQDYEATMALNAQAPEQQTTAPDPALVARERRARRRELAYEQARRARTGLVTMMVVAGWAISQAAQTEPNRAVREQRRNILSDTWRRFSGDLMRQAGRL